MWFCLLVQIQQMDWEGVKEVESQMQRDSLILKYGIFRGSLCFSISWFFKKLKWGGGSHIQVGQIPRPGCWGMLQFTQGKGIQTQTSRFWSKIHSPELWFPTKWEGRFQQVSLSYQESAHSRMSSRSPVEKVLLQRLTFLNINVKPDTSLKENLTPKKTLLCRSSVEGLEHFAGSTEHLTELESEMLLSS